MLVETVTTVSRVNESINMFGEELQVLHESAARSLSQFEKGIASIFIYIANYK